MERETVKREVFVMVQSLPSESTKQKLTTI